MWGLGYLSSTSPDPHIFTQVGTGREGGVPVVMVSPEPQCRSLRGLTYRRGVSMRKSHLPSGGRGSTVVSGEPAVNGGR